MTTTNDDRVFTEPVTYINTACPEWCTSTRVLHPCDMDYGNGVHSRFHEGPRFGPWLHGFGEEFTTDPGNVRVDVELCVDRPGGDQAFLTPEELRQLARDAVAAADWLEARVRGERS